MNERNQIKSVTLLRCRLFFIRALNFTGFSLIVFALFVCIWKHLHTNTVGIDMQSLLHQHSIICWLRILGHIILLRVYWCRVFVSSFFFFMCVAAGRWFSSAAVATLCHSVGVLLCSTDYIIIKMAYLYANVDVGFRYVTPLDSGGFGYSRIGTPLSARSVGARGNLNTCTNREAR